MIIDLQNAMEGLEVTIHWHGIWQRGSQYYDGVPFVTQCPIQQGNTFRYQWTAGNAGTHFWHAHTGNSCGYKLKLRLFLNVHFISKR